MSLENWAIDKLSVFLGFDPETLQSQILPYLMSSNSPDAFAEQLMVTVYLDRVCLQNSFDVRYTGYGWHKR
jgi:hypothetical protein